jgi:hypothetical protein
MLNQPAEDAADAALVGFQDAGVISQEQIGLVFNTVAQECKTQEERTLYLLTCKASGLSPLKKELYATRRKGQLVFVTSFHVFVSRARRAGFTVHGEVVCEGDDWGGWDAVALAPVKHLIGGVNRGPIVGAYGWGEHLATGKRVGGWWDWRELILENGGNPTWKTMPQHMAKRIAWLRIARLIAPDLSSLYGAEEFGEVVELETHGAVVTEVA